MISENVFISKNEETGIYYILINLKNRWINYQLNRYPQDDCISFTKYTSEVVEYMPGEFEDYDSEETDQIFIEKGFNNSNYIITHTQEKDQIIIMCTPENLILGSSKFFKPI